MRPSHLLRFTLILWSSISLVRPCSSQDPTNEDVPEGFVFQDLDPIGGRILKPRDWLFTSKISGKTLVYTLHEPSKAKTGFDNGLTINVVLDAKKTAKMNPSAYAEKYLARIRNAGRDVVELKKRSYGENWVSKALIATERKTLTGEPKDYRIIYETHAEDKRELLVVLVFGTTAEVFDDYEKIYKTMSSRFLLMDRKRALERKKQQKLKTKPALKKTAGK